jgi:Family of unknown function (DUF6191)
MAVWVTSIPVVVLLLMLVWLCERAWYRARRLREPGTPMSEASFDEFTAFFYGAKRVELDQRATNSMMREDEESGAPPNPVDLDKGVVMLDRRHGGAT